MNMNVIYIMIAFNLSVEHKIDSEYNPLIMYYPITYERINFAREN